jgi:RHS repeat-associated protein
MRTGRTQSSGTESIYYYHLDHLGTPLKLTDQNKDVVWSMECSPFMEFCIEEGDVFQPLRFPGQYYDEETGLHYNWSRFYKPDWGRYIEVDPIGQLGYLNVYLYVSNNPISNVDNKGVGVVQSIYGCANNIAKGLNSSPSTRWWNDKFKHCVGSYLIRKECGPLSALISSFGKEFMDLVDFNPNTHPEMADLKADFAGINCYREVEQIPACEKVGGEECCKRKGYSK